ncbi:hypothetical protein DFS34DRAFT_651317 [Phlyctochytrium arcticum]|nr:hypothetical protein DFS34DRAFT_651317 [Phlyctochytrium arcticum]
MRVERLSKYDGCINMEPENMVARYSKDAQQRKESELTSSINRTHDSAHAKKLARKQRANLCVLKFSAPNLLSNLLNWKNEARSIPASVEQNDVLSHRATREGSYNRPRIDLGLAIQKLLPYARDALNIQGALRSISQHSPYYQKLLKRRIDNEAEMEQIRSVVEAGLQSEHISSKPLPPLSATQTQLVEDVLSTRNLNKIISSAFNIDIAIRDLHTLRDGSWLNDEVINFYGQLIMKRNASSPDMLKVHCFNTFFYKYLGQNYNLVRKWTRKIDIFEYDMLIIPIHLGNHWTVASINFRKHRFEYYDSLRGREPNVFALLRSYLDQEMRDKKKMEWNGDGWSDFIPSATPFQLNGNDCGVFSCMFMYYLASGRTFDFDGTQMPYFRRRIICEIAEKALFD